MEQNFLSFRSEVLNIWSKGHSWPMKLYHLAPSAAPESHQCRARMQTRLGPQTSSHSPSIPDPVAAPGTMWNKYWNGGHPSQTVPHMAPALGCMLHDVPTPANHQIRYAGKDDGGGDPWA